MDAKDWIIESSTYIKMCIRKVEIHHVVGGRLFPHKIPLPADCCPENLTSELLDDKYTKIYQMLIGLMQRDSVIGRLDVCFVVFFSESFLC